VPLTLALHPAPVRALETAAALGLRRASVPASAAQVSVSTVIDGVPLTLSDGFPVSVSRPL